MLSPNHAADCGRAVQIANLALLKLFLTANADTIYVFDRGRIVESGHHAELVAGGGLYARLSELQFREGATAEPD